MSDLKDLITPERSFNWRQAGIALLLGSAVLALIVFFIPKPEAQPQKQTEEPQVTASNPYDRVRLEAKAAIVYDIATGETLYERNAEAQLPLASLTKLLTIYAASEVLPRQSTVTVTETALATEGDSGLMEGESFSFADLARLALVASSNDATEAIRQAAETRTASSGRSLLAAAAEAMHLSQTYALNGTGLDENTSTSGAYGSARDVAQLAAALLKQAPDLAEATTARSITVSSLQGMPHTLKNTNQEIVEVPGALLSKTGFTDLAGGNLVVVFDAGIGHPVAVVVLGSSREGRFTDVDELVRATTATFAGLPTS